MSDIARQRRIDHIFEQALDVEAAGRDRFIAQACGDDVELAGAVRKLLAHLDEPTSMLTGNALAGALFEDLAQQQTKMPERIGPYRILSELGRGGMAVVYLGERADVDFQHRVAIKVIQGEAATDSVLKRFSRERAILASFEHPGIARLFDGGTTVDGRPYFAMECICGDPIDQYCEKRKLWVNDRLKLFLAVLEAVQYAHRNLIVHRDIKASNILVTEDGQVKLLDFGIAKLLDPTEQRDEAPLTMHVALPMTPQCASPEQIRGERITTASDVYQLGLLLYQLLTGRFPYRVDRADRRSVVKAIIEQEPTRPSTVVRRAEAMHDHTPFMQERALQRRLKGDLDAIILKAMRKEPEHRYASVDQFAEDIERYLQRLPVHARAGTVAYHTAKFVGRHSRGLLVAAAVSLVFAGASVAYLQQIKGERDRATFEADKAQHTMQLLFNMFEAADPELGLGPKTSAIEMLDYGSRQIASELQTQPAAQAETMDWIGRIYTKLGAFDRAESLLTAALEKRRALSPVPEQDVAETLTNLAALYQEQGRFDEAEALDREALTLTEHSLGKDHLLVAQSLNRVANALTRKREFEAARVMLERAKDIESRQQPVDEAALAETLISLSWLHDEQGDTETARDLAARAVTMAERALGPNDPRLHRALYLYARALQGHGEYKHAIAAYERDLLITERAYGRNNARVGDILVNLAFSTRMSGDLERALYHARGAVEVRRALVGIDHPSYATALAMLGQMYLETGQTEEAGRLCREAVAIYERAPGIAPFTLIFGLAALGDYYVETGQYSEALKISERVRDVLEPARSPDHPDLARTYLNLGMSQMLVGRIEDAEATLRRTLRIVRESKSEYHADLADTALALGELVSHHGDAKEAERLLREAIAIWEHNVPAGHPKIAQAQSALGAHFTRQRRYNEAEPLLVKSNRVLARYPTRAARDAAAALAQLRNESGRTEMAREVG